MSYGVSLESMMIPNTTRYPEELEALENWIITMESELIAEDVNSYIAMEAEGSEAGGSAPSSFVTKIRTAFNNLRAGKKNGDEAAVNAAAQEIQQASDDFDKEAANETDPEKKKKWKKAAAIIAAIVAAVGIAIGATALAKKAKGKANSGDVSTSEAKSLVNEVVTAAKKAEDVIAPKNPQEEINPPSSKPVSTDSTPAHGRGTGAAVVNPDGTQTRLLSREEKKDVNRTAKYTTQNPNGSRAERRAKKSTFMQETPMQKKTRLLKEAAQKQADSGQIVSKELDRRIQHAEQKVNRQETANAHGIIAQTNALRGEQKKAGQEPASTPVPANNQKEVNELLAGIQANFKRMQEAGGLTVKKTANNTFYKRTTQGKEAKVYRTEIDDMAKKVARLTQLGYSGGDALDLYNALKKAQT